MSRFAGCARFVYNKGIAWNEEQRNADSNFRISYKALSAQLPIWKENHPWLADTYSQCLQQAMKDLSQGFQRFFAGDAGFPKFHKKFASTDSFRFPQNFKINEGNKQILLPGIGWVKYRRSRECLDFCVQGGFQGGSQSRLSFVYRGVKITDQRLRGTLSRRQKCAKRHAEGSIIPCIIPSRW